jgi:hypothetical protein
MKIIIGIVGAIIILFILDKVCNTLMPAYIEPDFVVIHPNGERQIVNHKNNGILLWDYQHLCEFINLIDDDNDNSENSHAYFNGQFTLTHSDGSKQTVKLEDELTIKEYDVISKCIDTL